MMKNLLLAALLVLFPLAAEASNCSSNPFTLTNGQTADATQVMSNFNNLLNCANNNLAHNGANTDITSLSALTTPLSAFQGGSGVQSPTANSVLLGNGASAFQTVAPSTSGNVLQSNGTTWQSALGFASVVDATNGGLNIVNSTTNAVIKIQPSDLLIKVTPTSADSLFLSDVAASSAAKLSLIPAIVTGAAATKGQLQTATDNSTIVTPAHVQDSDAVAKALCTFNGNTVGTHSCDYVNNNVQTNGVVRNGTGDYTVTFTTAFASSNFGCFYGMGNTTANQRYGYGPVGAATSGSIHFQVTDSTVLADSALVSVACYGRQ